MMEPKVGDVVRKATWVNPLETREVTAIGRHSILVASPDGAEWCYDLADVRRNWVKATP